MRGSSSQLLLLCRSLALSAAAPDLRRWVAPLGSCPSGMGSSRLLPLTSDVGWLLSAALWRARRSCPHLIRSLTLSFKILSFIDNYLTLMLLQKNFIFKKIYRKDL